MIDIFINNEMLSRAQLKVEAVKFDSTRKTNQFGTEKKRAFIGFVGEQLVLHHLKTAVDVNHYDYDLIFNGLKIEVKTVSCNTKPALHYLCTVNSSQDVGARKQLADYYIFTRVLENLTIGWILGYMRCSEFFERGRYIEKGSPPVDGISFLKANATVLQIKELRLMKTDKMRSINGTP